jgi:helix-turn-helix protein
VDDPEDPREIREKQKEIKARQERAPGLYYVIPAEVFEDEDLEHSEIMFYGLLSGLSSRDGYCWATNAYLAKRMGKSDDRVKVWLSKLEDLGYIKRETVQEGSFCERRIFIMHARVKKKSPDFTDAPGGVHKRTPPPSAKTHHIVSKEREKERTPPLSPRFQVEPQKPSGKDAASCARLSEFLYQEILKSKPDFSQKPSKKWERDCQALVKLRRECDLFEIIRWALQDTFWKANIFSPGALLRNLDKLEARMKNPIGETWENKKKYQNRLDDYRHTSSERGMREQPLQKPGLINAMLQQYLIGSKESPAC